MRAVGFVVAALLSASGAFSQEAARPLVDATYRFAIGGAPVRAGTLWMYYAYDGDLRRAKVADISNSEVC